MKKSQIDLFFSEVDQRLQTPAEVIITGAAAGILMGHIRPSVDIDFEIRSKAKSGAPMDSRIENAVREASKILGIAVNFSGEIGRWSMIDFLDYREHARPYKKIGRLEIKLMDPAYWTIGKMGRFLEMDIDDIVKVLKKEGVRWEDLVGLWGRAFQASPLSLNKGHFRDHVIFFLKEYGKTVWGKNFKPEESVKLFCKNAGIRGSF